MWRWSKSPPAPLDNPRAYRFSSAVVSVRGLSDATEAWALRGLCRQVLAARVFSRLYLRPFSPLSRSISRRITRVVDYSIAIARASAIMHARALILASALLCVTTADPLTYYGSSSNFVAEVVEPSNNAVLGLYNGCSELNAAGAIVSTGSVCVARVISCMLKAVATVADDWNAVAGVTSTVNFFANSSAQSSGASQKRRSLDMGVASGVALSRRRASASRLDGPTRVTDMVRSDVHPHDGVAFRTNIQSDDSTLHVHTNGTHLMARFDGVGSASITRRDSVETNGSRFTFLNVAGIKLEAQGVNADGDDLDYAPDMGAFAYAFAFGDGFNTNFSSGDVWNFAVCRKAVRQRAFFGKVIAQLDPFNTHYETVSAPPACVQ